MRRRSMRDDNSFGGAQLYEHLDAMFGHPDCALAFDGNRIRSSTSRHSELSHLYRFWIETDGFVFAAVDEPEVSRWIDNNRFAHGQHGLRAGHFRDLVPAQLADYFCRCRLGF